MTPPTTTAPRPTQPRTSTARATPRTASPRPSGARTTSRTPAPRPSSTPPPGRGRARATGPRTTRTAPLAPVTRHDRRVRTALVVVLLVVGLFAVRLVQLQGLDASALARDALGSRLVVSPTLAERGEIVDRDGVVLATSVERRDITVDQLLVPSYQRSGTPAAQPAAPTEAAGPAEPAEPAGVDAAAQDIAAITGQSVDEVRAALSGDRRFAYVARSVPPQVWRQVQALDVPGVFSERTSARSYPAGAVAGNLLGFVVEGEGAGDTSGAGLELAFDDVLAGTDGSSSYERAAGGQMIPTGQRTDTAAVDGRDVRLSIDRDLQWFAQQTVATRAAEAGAQWASVVVMEVETGRILTIAEAPSVDPNSPGSVHADNRGSRALSEVFEPGSTAKVVTMAAALEEGVVEPETRFTVPDRYATPNGQSFRDSHPHPVESLTTAGVLAQSSNTGTVMIGERLDRRTRHDYLTRFGLGQPSGLGFPGETRGILAPPEDWDGRQQYTVLFGQGVSVNALQSAQVFATIANDGVRMTPRLVEAQTDASGEWQHRPAEPGTPVVSAETAQQVRTMLESAVTEGTGTNAAIPGYRVAGKTGTAQAPSDGGGYSGYTASFIGMAPAEDPKLVVAVTVQRPQNGYYGGTAAAPVFRDVMSFALQQLAIPPSGVPPTLYPLGGE